MRSPAVVRALVVPMCVFALSSGCTFKSDLPTDTEIKCASAEQCPPGWTCDVDAERCRLTGSDSPGLTSNDVTPSIGKQGTVFTLTLMASKPLARAPKIAGLEFVFDEAASAPTDLKYVFTYTAQGTEREGAFRLVAELKDGEGNTANVSVGTVTLDFTAPKPIAGSMKLVPSFARPGQAVLAQVDFDEVLRDGATLTQPELAVTGLMSTVRGTNTLAFRFNVPAAAPSGRYTFGVDSIEDLAGNRADDISAAGELSQGAALTIDSEAPKLEAIVLNRQNFSRVAGFDELQLTFNTGTDAATVTATLADVELTCSQTGMAGALNTWACTRRIDAADTEGVKTVKVSALDLAGNTAAETRSVTLDFTPPTVVAGSMQLSPELARAADRVIVQVNFSEILAPGAQLQQSALGLANIASSVQNNVALAFSFTVPPTAADGKYPFTLTGVVDLAGNSAPTNPLERQLTVDSSIPTTANVQLNAANRRYSRQTGFDVVTVTFDISEVDAVATAQLGAEVMTCTAPTPATRSCTLRLSNASVEGLGTIQLTARDAIGNSSTNNQNVTLDFSPPQLAGGTFQGVLVPGGNSLLPQVTALGDQGLVKVTFSTTERLPSNALPTLKLDSMPMTCTGGGVLFQCSYLHSCGGLADGAHSFAITMADDVGNVLPTQTVGQVTTDCTAPLPPDVATSRVVQWHRAPFGTTWSQGLVGSQLELAPDAVQETGVTVRVGADLGGGRLAPIATAFIDDVKRATVMPVTDRVDRPQVSVQTVDSAGNGSAIVKVLDNIATVQFTGPDVTPSAPGLFDRAVSDTSIVTSSESPRARVVSSFLNVNVFQVPSATPAARRYATLTPLSNGRALLFGGQNMANVRVPETWVFDQRTQGWLAIGGSAPQPRFGHQIATLPDGRAFLFGGDGANGVLNDMWLFDPATMEWSRLTGLLVPLPRTGHQMIALASRRILMMGGQDAAGTELGDSWLFNPETLTWKLVQGPQPTARAGHALVALGNTDALVFGGQDSSDRPLNDSWVFDGATEQWVDVTGAEPPARLPQQMIRLGDGDVLLFSGAGNVTNDTWVFDASVRTWSPRTGAAPPARYGAQFALLPTGEVLLCGGYTSGGALLTDSWLFDPTMAAWKTQVGFNMPPRGVSAVASLTTGEVLVATGQGGNNEVLGDGWLYNGISNRWSQVVPPQPSARFGHKMAVLQNGLVLLFGGTGASFGAATDQWVFDANSARWSPLTGPQPPGRAWHQLVTYGNNSVLLNGGGIADTWTFDGNVSQWTQRGGTQPPARVDSRMTVLSNGRVLMSHGSLNGNSLSDSWVFNPVTNLWAPVGGTQPPARSSHSLVGRLGGTALLFGGFSSASSTYLQDTWLYNAATNSWAVQALVNSPSARAEAGAALLTLGNVLVVGGVGNNGMVNDSSRFMTTGTWSQDTAPPGNRSSFAITALPGNRALLFGGQSNSRYLGDAFIYNEANSQWVPLAGTQPPARQDAQLVAATSRRAVLFGGRSTVPALGDTWVYEVLGSTTTAMGSLPLASLGIRPSQVKVLNARAVAGADGFDINDSGPLNGFEIEVFRVADDGELFQTCITSPPSATASSPGLARCDAVPFAGSTWVAMRVKPTGFSNGKTVSLNVTSAELDIAYVVTP